MHSLPATARTAQSVPVARSQSESAAPRPPQAKPAEDGVLLPSDRPQHVDNQLDRARTVLQRSVDQGRLTPDQAREYFGILEERGAAWASETPSESSLSPAAQHALNQVERARDVLQRSVNQGRIDPAGARDYFTRLEERAANWVEEQS